MALEEMEDDIRDLQEQVARFKKVATVLVATHPGLRELKQQSDYVRKIVNGTWKPFSHMSKEDCILYYLDKVDMTIKGMEE